MLGQCVSIVNSFAVAHRGLVVRGGVLPQKRPRVERLGLSTGRSRSFWKSTASSITGNVCPKAEAAHWATPALPAELLAERNPFLVASHAPKTPEKLHVREHGTGSNSVVMLHGLSQTGDAWKPLLKHMNDRQFRYICPDLLGHGESSCTPQLKYTVNTHVHFLQRDVTNVIGSRGGLILSTSQQAPFRLVGVGLGAILAVELAARMPSRVLSLHLISLPCYENDKEASEDMLSHLIHPMGEFKLLSRVSSALISHNEDIIKPLIDVTRLVSTPRSPESTTNFPEQIHAVCSTVDECMIKHRIHDSAAHLARARLRMDLIQGAQDTVQHNKMAERFYTKFVNAASIFYLDGASSDIPKLNAEALGLLLTRDYLTKSQ